MKSYRLWPSLFFFISCLIFQGKAQSLEEFKIGKNNFFGADGGPHWGFHLSYSSLSNNEAPRPDVHSISGFSMKMDYKRYNLGRGERRMVYQNKTIGDLLFALGSEIRTDKGAERGENSAITTGLIGWTSWGWNLLSKEKTALALGFNINDYIIGATYVYSDAFGNNLSPTTTEPQGYYWGAGPSIFFDYLINEKLLLQVHSMYDLSFWRPVSLDYAVEDNAYPKPHFLHFSVELETQYHVYFGLDYAALLNQGNLPNNTKRFDILLGYRF